MNPRSALETSGYAVLRGALDVPLLQQVRMRALLDVSKGTMDCNGLNRGYPVKMADYLPLIDAVDRAMEPAGLAAERLEDVMLIPKIAGEARRYWHIDAARKDGQPLDVFALCYLENTSEENGCLLVGRNQPDFWDAANAKYGEALEGEVPVPVQIGDLVILNYRWPHGAYANRSPQDRLMIRLQIELKGNG